MVEATRLRNLFYQSEQQARRDNCVQATIFGAVFMLVGVSLDLVVYPEMVGEIFVNRLVTAFLLIALGLSVKLRFSFKFVKIMLHAAAILPQASIAYMIYQTEGAQSPYYGGLNLVLVGAALLLRWSTWDSVLNVLFCMMMYYLAILMHGSSWNDAFIPSYFIFVTGAIATASAFFYNQARFREFCLSLEVSEANKKLEDSNQQLRTIDETKSRFFANLSHELRTPLTLILGPVENLRLMLDDSPDTIRDEYLDMIEENGYRLLRLINDILDLVKLDSGESPPRPEAVEVQSFIDGMASNIRQIASLKGVSVSSCCEVDVLPVVWMDRDRLEKIILNLSVNAVKFTASGGVVALSAEIEKEKICFSVTDTGQGMAEEEVENVFVRFWQADMSAKRKHGGAGIGLSLVKSLTESMGGEVSVSSKLDEGTSFRILLPAIAPPEVGLMPEEDSLVEDVLEKFNRRARINANRVIVNTYVAADEVVQSEVREEPVSSVDLDGEERKRVLVADDEDAMRHFLTRQLSDYDLVEARNGDEAWRLAQDVKLDLVITDLMMPGLDGVELTRKMRQDERLSRVPVILVTADTSEASRLNALQAGVNDFISKPFSTVELKVRAKNLLSSAEFEVQLAENNKRLESAYEQLKEQESLLVQTEKLSSLGRMSAGIVHEVNNPLNYAKTALHALETFKGLLPDDELEDYLDVLGDAREGVQRVIGIVSDLRAFTRGDSSQMSEVMLVNVVESARRLTSSLMSGIKFEVKIDSDIWVDGNEGQLCQLLVNFFQNSIRAIEVKGEESGEISVSAKKLEDGFVSLSVEDNGCGMSPDVKEQIFDPFFTQNDVGEGMGLGLSICHRIIEQHKASVSVESELGAFSRFIIIFPDKV